jgi:hypothetical protein
MVPAYMKRVEFKLNEITFNQCINEAEKELNIEQQMLSRNENINLILRRNIVRVIHFIIICMLTNLNLMIFRNTLIMV